MCEIAILGTNHEPAQLAGYSIDIYNSMRSSLGVMSVFDGGGSFEYEMFKRLDPDVDPLINYYTENDDALFHIIHGRMATHGAVTQENQHPLQIDCDECGVDHVIHNGVVAGWRELRDAHEYSEHDYSSEVDSEAIAHEYGDVPDQIEETTEQMRRFSYQPAYLLLNEDRIFIHSSGHSYHLTDKPRMAKPRRPFGPDYREDDYNIVLVTPNA